jgi:hypothetical protein
LPVFSKGKTDLQRPDTREALREVKFMRIKVYFVLVATVAAALVLFSVKYGTQSISAQAPPPITYGTLDNFDVINDTGGSCHGFEIELEGISSADVAYTFGAPYQRYGDPTIVPTATGVIIRYAATYVASAWSATTPIAVAPYPPTQGHSCWTGGDPNYYSSGCDHFGASLNAVPTRTTYRWLIENPAAPGTLMTFGSNAPLPAPIWNVVPAATPGDPPAVDTVISPIAPAAGAKFGEPMWVKVYLTTLPNAVHAEDLDHMVIDDPNVNIVPNEPAEIEWEWMLLQAKDNGGVISGDLTFTQPVPDGSDAISRRFEFYKYTGQTDPDPDNLGEALCDNPTALDQQLPASPRCGEPDANGVAGVGDLIGAQNAAVNLLGPVIVTPENHPPVANTDNLSIAEDNALTVVPADLLGNDVDLDNDVLHIDSAQDAFGGTVNWDGANVVFTPASNYNGPAGFTYTIGDGYFIETGIVNVTVTPVNDKPVASAGSDQTVRMGDIVTLNGGGSSDVDVGDVLTYSWSLTSTPAKSRAALNGATSANPSFKADKAGTYILSLTVNDGTIDSDPVSVTITAVKGKK